ncbi:MAG: uroporphyrinogen-III synthase [Alphaproteobacteria bacterium]
MKARRIWLTRPREDSAALAKALAAQDIDSLIAPVLSIEPVKLELDARPDGIILTSKHALAALKGKTAWHGLPVYAVGGATVAAARKQGFTNVRDGGGNAMSLATLIARHAARQKLLYPCGEETRHDLPTLLAARGVKVTAVTAYRAVTGRGLPKDFSARAKTLTGAAFFSPRSAEAAMQLLAKHAIACKKLTAYCLSLDIAAVLGEGWGAVKVAERPAAEAMIKLIVSS